MLDLPVVSLLERTRPTLPQVDLDERQRQENVAGAFALDPSWSMTPGKRIALIDDVRTTGATTEACAAVLCLGGLASQVSVVTFAREVVDAELLDWLSLVRGDDAAR
jgi:predicted amidophosphoribosyltransferase